MNQEIINQYGNHLRVRVCGICVQDGKILLINHSGMNESGEFWSPPGGGLQFGETIEECLKREFLEETNTIISVGNFLKINEFVKPPLHAIELFYEVKIVSGDIQIGFDPEMEQQIIKEVKWLSFEEVLQKEEGRFARVLLEIASLF
ncbi:8-oxo-dGTP diphosphatase [Arcicella aurantiaca]|uniref:8-oxo-dGTP diphosphatase n=1 Tax=Arcicella aurantiaca TaxID=591202 RepID=A0A316EGP6_9BACT|nr:NUDIX hydrolase [Arcicella aurantiaca]PWK29244.1 8-oxo-dGTP diphosphatase [Arcicella aurantiaca]